jgi:putative endonuclease
VSYPAHYVYLLRCANGTIYTGLTHVLESRLKRHFTGAGARHTDQVKPIELIYTEGPMPYRDAVDRERQIKKWSRAKKIVLASGNLDQLRKLSQSRSKQQTNPSAPRYRAPGRRSASWLGPLKQLNHT